MRTNRWRQWRIVLAAVVTAFCFGACQEWGQMDPPAGTDIYPKTEKVGEYSFDEAIDPQVMQTFAYVNGDTPDLVQDADLGSQVLHFNGGYVRFFNPMLATSAEEAVSMTFWVKQAALDEAEVAAGTAVKDINSALFAFQNENGTESLYMTGNGALVYEGMDGNLSVNTADEATTGMLDEPGVWHYVALMVHNDGYTVYVDGNKRIDQYIPDFDCSKLVQFMANTPYLYIGYGAEENKEWWIDDLTIYRNKISSTQIARPGSGSGSNLPEIGFFFAVEGAYMDIRSVGYCPYIENGGSYTIGAADNTAAWWTVFSDYMTVPDKNTLNWRFTNYTNSSANWCNWVIVFTNGKERDAADYVEYVVLRADAYGWGTYYNAANLTHNYNFDTFATDMNGADVQLKVTRDGNDVTMTTVTTTESGAVYNYDYHFEVSEGIEDLGVFLTCEGAHLTFNAEDVVIGEVYEPGSYLVGATDCSAGWWTVFSKFSTVQDTPYPFTYVFYNYTNQSANWCNWVLVCTNGKDREEEGYAEHFVLRADAYGWGDANYNGTNIVSSFDWNTFPADMNGAYCRIFLIRDNNRVDMTARTRTTDGRDLGEYTFFYEGL